MNQQSQVSTQAPVQLLLPAPPAAPDLESAVLGACLLDRYAFAGVAPILSRRSFSKWENEEVYIAMSDLLAKSLPIDLMTVTERVNKRGKLPNAASYVIELTNAVTGPAHLEYHSQILKQYEIQRGCIETGAYMVRAGFDQKKDPLALLEEVQKMTMQLTGMTGTKRELSAGQLAKNSVDRVNRIRSAAQELTGIPSGLVDLDRLTDGFQNSDLVIIAARPGMGKTAWMLSVAKNVADSGTGVGVFSLEMNADQLTTRYISMQSGLPISFIRNPRRMDEGHLDQYFLAAGVLSDAPLWIDDTPSLSILEFKAKARRMVLEHGVGILFVDYLQLMVGDSSGSGNRDQEIGQISRALKATAKELDIPIIALSQLSRAVEARGGLKRPQLSDLRESGNIEQDGDIVGFIYRPEYYMILEDMEGNSTKGLAELIIAKHRNGALDTVKMRFLEKRTQFCNFEEQFNGTVFSNPNSRIEATGANSDEDLPF
jgi:replicative DNA helicase